MIGFDAIAHYNGWAMALAGASIVLSGLAVLSFIISQLHKLVNLLEKKEAPDIEQPLTVSPETPATPSPKPEHCPANIKETAETYQTLTAELGPQFQLIELYALAKKYNFPHPHLDLRCLREAGLLIPQGDGEFRLAD